MNTIALCPLRKGTILLMLLLVWGLVLSSCGTDPGPGESEPEQVTFRVAWWGTVARHELRHALYHDILDKYEQANPHVTILREIDNFSDYWNRIATQAAGGNEPEIITLHTQMFGREYPQKNMVLPLDEYVERGIINLDDWEPSIVEAGKVDGKLYTIPKGVTAAGMIINVDMIGETGLTPPPAEGMTYEQFYDWALLLQARLPEGSYVVHDAGDNESIFDTYVRNLGKSMYTADGKALGFDLEDVIHFWTYWNKLREKGAVPPPELSVEYSGKRWEHSMFVNRITAIEFQNTNQGKIFQTFMDDQVDIVRLPMVKGAPFKSGENLIASGFSITRHADPNIRDELARFINWFVNDPEAALLYNAEVGVVGPDHIKEQLRASIAPTDVLAFEHIETIASDIPRSEPWAEGGAEVRDMYRDYYEQMRFGQLSLEEAARAFYQDASERLQY